MKYISTWENFKDAQIGESKVNEFFKPVDKYEVLKYEINDELKTEFPKCEIHAYYITKNPHETRMAVVITKINIMPYTEEYKNAILNNDRTVKFTSDMKYNDEFKEMMADIKSIIVINDLDLFEITLSPICKNEIERELHKNKYK